MNSSKFSPRCSSGEESSRGEEYVNGGTWRNVIRVGSCLVGTPPRQDGGDLRWKGARVGDLLAEEGSLLRIGFQFY